MIRRPRIRRGVPVPLLALALVLGLVAPFGSSLPASADDSTPPDGAPVAVTVTVPEATASPTSPTQPMTPGKTGSGSGSGTGSGGGAGGSAGTGTAVIGSAGVASATEAKEPSIPKAPAGTAERAAVDRATYRPGDTVTVSSEGFAPGEQVQIVLFGDGTLVANVAADAEGRVQHAFALPKELNAGQHTVQLTGWQSHRVAASRFLVELVPATAAPGIQGVPPWAWWAGGGIGLLLLLGVAWWLVRALRVPEARTA